MSSFNKSFDSKSDFDVEDNDSASGSLSDETMDESVDYTDSENEYEMDGVDEMEEPEKPIIGEDVPMIPEGVDSHAEIADSFESVFELRYGDVRPSFFRGSLQEANKAAFKVQKRPLAIYLHKDGNKLSHRFPQRTLAQKPVVDMLKERFVVWGWDVSTDMNAMKLGQQMAAASMRRIYQSFEKIEPERFPMLMLITAPRSVHRIDNIIEGNVHMAHVMAVLANQLDSYAAIMVQERENEERSRIMNEQRAAYEMSLAADRARMEAKLEAERIQQEKEAEEQRQKEEEERIEREKQAEADRKKAMLPEEPSASDNDVVALRVRFPGGELVNRRFRTSEKLGFLLLFVESRGFLLNEHDVFNADRPRRKVTEMNVEASFADLKWPKREMIIVEEMF